MDGTIVFVARQRSLLQKGTGNAYKYFKDMYDHSILNENFTFFKICRHLNLRIPRSKIILCDDSRLKRGPCLKTPELCYYTVLSSFILAHFDKSLKLFRKSRTLL